jgi:hypothetical protein
VIDKGRWCTATPFAPYDNHFESACSADAVVASVLVVEASTVDVELFIEQHPPAFFALAVLIAEVPQSSFFAAVALSVAQASAFVAVALSVAQASAFAVDVLVAFVAQHDAFLTVAFSSQRALAVAVVASIDAAHSSTVARIIRAFIIRTPCEMVCIVVVSNAVYRRFAWSQKGQGQTEESAESSTSYSNWQNSPKENIGEALRSVVMNRLAVPQI